MSERISASDTPKAFCLAAGMGYMFNAHLGAELRYTSGKFEPNFYGMKESVTCPAINASAIFRF